MAADPIDMRIRFDVADSELTGLHARAFGNQVGDQSATWSPGVSDSRTTA